MPAVDRERTVGQPVVIYFQLFKTMDFKVFVECQNLNCESPQIEGVLNPDRKTKKRFTYDISETELGKKAASHHLATYGLEFGHGHGDFNVYHSTEFIGTMWSNRQRVEFIDKTGFIEKQKSLRER